MSNPAEDATEELNGLLATRAYLQDKVTADRKRLEETARGDKATANVLKQQMLRDEAELRKLRPHISRLQERVEQQKRHSDFMTAIADLYGPDAMPAIRQRVKEIKQARKAEHEAKP